MEPDLSAEYGRLRPDVVRALRLLHDAIADIRDSMNENEIQLSDWHNVYAAERLIETLETELIDGSDG